MSGNMPAQTTAKIVMASAKRLMELRQLCLKSSKMAEMSVPAWPMPIHHTKLMIAKPQATGCVMAQIPTPLRNSQVTATNSITARPPKIPKRASQPSGVCGVSTMREIFSVIDRKVWPGPITRNSPVAGSTPGSWGFISRVAICSSTLGRYVLHRHFLLFQFRIRIQDFRDITSSRTRVLVGNHLVSALLRVELRHAAVRIGQVAEDDGRGRARLLACGHDLAIANRPVFLVGFDLGGRDALYAVAALLHHAARTDRHIRIPHQLEAWRFKVGVEQEVEPPHLVGAVVGAIPGAHAAVIDHHVEAFVGVDRSAHRANLLAGSVLALLAKHRLEMRARGSKITFEVGVDANPLHVAADAHLLLAYDGDVVLRIAADDAGVAAGAAVHVDRHGPAVSRIGPVGEQRGSHLCRFAPLTFMREVGIRLELFQRGVANNAARPERFNGFERPVLVSKVAQGLAAMILEVALGDGDAPLAIDLLDRTGRVERRPGVANPIGIEARARTHAARKLAAVAEIAGHRIVRMAGSDDNRRLHAACAHAQFYDVIFFEAELRQRRARNDRGVIPAEAGDRLGQFLQPAHVRPAAVIDVRIGAEDDFDGILWRWRRYFGRSGLCSAAGCVGRVSDPAVVERDRKSTRLN